MNEGMHGKWGHHDLGSAGVSTACKSPRSHSDEQVSGAGWLAFLSSCPVSVSTTQNEVAIWYSCQEFALWQKLSWKILSALT